MMMTRIRRRIPLLLLLCWSLLLAATGVLGEEDAATADVVLEQDTANLTTTEEVFNSSDGMLLLDDNTNNNTLGDDDNVDTTSALNETEAAADPISNGTSLDNNETAAPLDDDDDDDEPTEHDDNNNFTVIDNNTTFINLEPVPWDLSCSRNPWYGCGEHNYCSYSHGDRNSSRCVLCPAPDDLEQCNITNPDNQEAIDDCWYMCGYAQTDQDCATWLICEPGASYCNYPNRSAWGTCVECPTDLNECMDRHPDNDYVLEECLSCELRCMSIIGVELEQDNTAVNDKQLPSFEWKTVEGSVFANASGELVNCTNLKSEPLCPEAQGQICVVEEREADLNAYYLDWVHRCENSGGVGFILVVPRDMYPYIKYYETTIPVVSIVVNETSREKVLGPLYDSAHVVADLTALGQYCHVYPWCDQNIPCVGIYEGYYCNDAVCNECPTLSTTGEASPMACFFEQADFREMQLRGPAVQSCADTCGGGLQFKNCKFCPTDVTGIELDTTLEAPEDQCHFCPQDDLQYPNRDVSVFGDVQCWQVLDFFESVPVHKDSQNCKLLQMYNYVCGCTGPGYGGANTHTKKVVLAWLPRVMAILSVLGSTFIIYDALRARERRRQVFNHLMVVLSVFDIVGGVAYAFTTLPIPETEYIYGARGNDASCSAQGFFIQMGTISCFMNVSLAVYYLLVIKMGWSEHRVKKIMWILISLPVLIGLGFAFGGIPFYGSAVLWCNNLAELWPDIPIAAAIFFATLIMGVVCLDVYQKERVSARWRGTGAGRASSHLSQKVFWQSFWYLMAFYLTWPPYLAFQFFLASGKAYTEYGLVLAAATAVPLQGFWNFFVYIRPRYLSKTQTRRSRTESARIRTSGPHQSFVRFFRASKKQENVSIVKESLKTSVVASGTGTNYTAGSGVSNVSVGQALDATDYGNYADDSSSDDVTAPTVSIITAQAASRSMLSSSAGGGDSEAVAEPALLASPPESAAAPITKQEPPAAVNGEGADESRQPLVTGEAALDDDPPASNGGEAPDEEDSAPPPPLISGGADAVTDTETSAAAEDSAVPASHMEENKQLAAATADETNGEASAPNGYTERSDSERLAI